jgi:DNA-binding CsgD family transcriptional regulator
VLAGQAGVGKTFMAREALMHAEALRRDTEWVAASRAAASIPFGAVSRLLAPDVAVGAAPIEMLRASAGHMLRRATVSPVVLGVDDAHLLDSSSAALVHELMLCGSVFLLATIDAGEPVPDAILALWKDGLARRLNLRPLGEAAVDELLHRVLGPGIEGVTRHEIHRLTEGSPLLLRELLAGALDDGALIESDGVWRWAGRPRYGASLAELVEGRLPAAGEPARTILELLALAGCLPVAVIDRLVGHDVLDQGAVQAAEAGGHIAVVRSGRREALRLAHPIYGEVIKMRLPKCRAGQLWRWLAAAASCIQPRRHDDALRSAVWRMRAALPQPSSACLAAARLAVGEARLGLAAELISAAQRGAWPPGSADLGRGAGAEADLALAQVLSCRGRHRAAEAMLTGTPPADRDARIAWAGTRAWISYWRHGLVSDTRQQLAEIAADDAPSLDGADAVMAWLLLFDGQPGRALDAARTGAARHDDGASDWPFPAAAEAFASCLTGRTEAALALIDRYLARPAPGRPPYAGRVLLGLARCLAMISDGRAVQARSHAGHGYAEAIARRNPGTAAAWAICLGVADLRLGRLTAADAHLREALASLGRRDPYQLSKYVLSELAAAAALRADGYAAAEWMRRADESQAGVNRMFDSQIELNRAWTLAANGELTSAAAQARRAADLARSAGQRGIEAIALYDVARLGKPRSVLQRLTSLGRACDGALVPLMATAAAALASPDAMALEGAAAALDALGLPLLAAEVSAAAARAYRLAGRRASASACSERARSLAAGCDGARTPLLRSDDLVSILTQRQREISMLAAAGMPSKTIAARLLISTRTVNNHLASVYDRLGVSSRSQLAWIMSDEPRPGQRQRGLSA